MMKTKFVLQHQGAEAKVYFGDFCGKPAILKERFVKGYRHEALDRKLTHDRIRGESRALIRCSSLGLKCPTLYFVDLYLRYIIMEQVEDSLSVKNFIDEFMKESSCNLEKLDHLAVKMGRLISTLHKNNLIHGDLTTSNMLLKNDQKSAISTGANFDLYIIDFGLSFTSTHHEDKCVDLYVLERAFLNTNPKSTELFQLLLETYFDDAGACGPEIRRKFDEVRKRGRKRTMTG